jgi:SAM-dependent methyltransferase
MSAFAQAMFDQLRQPGLDLKFRLRIVDGPGIDCPCRYHVYLRHEEQALIHTCLGGRQEPHVLDIGCGIGRHSAFVRLISPHARITVVDADKDLRDYCLSVVPGAIGYERFDDVPVDARFDTVLLMGNSVGIFGTESATRQHLQRIHGLVLEGGCVLIETGNFTKDPFYPAQEEIEYNGLVDGPFPCGYATHDWLQSALGTAGFTVLSITASKLSDRPSPFFICHAMRQCAPGGAR